MSQTAGRCPVAGRCGCLLPLRDDVEAGALIALTIAGRLDPAALVTHRLGMSEGPAAYAMLVNRADGVGKALLDPTR